MPLATWLYAAIKRGGPALRSTLDVHEAQTVKAYVNYGQWVAECPSGDGGAIVASRMEPFMCPACWNEDWGGQWLAVVFPKAKAEIEAELLKRPKVANAYRTRNWVEGESVTDLKVENAAHGVGVG